ncbi:MAG: hypothetical protein IKE52_01350 [Mogibacterium sp.]|nr:hypothetical protein [Mogibacterium sp.]
MITVTKKQIIAVFAVELLLLICICLDNYYKQEFIYRGNSIAFDKLYIYLLLPLRHATTAWLLSLPAYLVVKSVGGEKKQFRYKHIAIFSMSIIALIISSMFFVNHNNAIIKASTVLGVIIGGVFI